jgi:hypothetical protein
MMEALSAEDRTWVAGMPTRRSDLYTKSPPTVHVIETLLPKPFISSFDATSYAFSASSLKPEQILKQDILNIST